MADEASTTGDGAARTPLYDLHLRLGARMTPFAGYAMPLNYPMGVLKEHLHCRAAAGLFDVSHMGQIAVRPRSGDAVDAARALERLTPADVLGLAPGRQRYALLTNDAGGILDDLMIAHRGDHLLLVVNAACKHADLAHLEAALAEDCVVEPLFERGLLALQGPAAEEALAAAAPEAAETLRAMRFLDVRTVITPFGEAVAARSGYTGEDGFEIGLAAEAAPPLAERLLAEEAVAPIGLGARDSLRLEAGLSLYGADLDETTTPVEAGLAWAIGKARRAGGARAGGFPGARVVLEQMASGPGRRRIGLRGEGRAPIRGGATLFASAEAAAPIGRVTSGGFGPSVAGPVAMGVVEAGFAATGTALFAEVRGKRLPARVADTPFVAPGFRR